MWRHRLALLAVAVAATASAQETVECPAADGRKGRVYAVEQFNLTWCWPPLPGSPLYRVETRTFDDAQALDAAWVEEAVVDTNHVTLRRDLGDTVELRVSACWGAECTDYGGPSRQVRVLPDFDANGDGRVGGPDVAALVRQGRVGGATFGQLLQVFGKRIVNRRYE